MDSDSNHGELGDKYENQSPSTSMAPVRVCEHSVVPGGVIPNFGRGKLISSYDQIISDDENTSRSGRILSLRMRSSNMNNQGTELIYEATLRRAMLYGIHIQGTVIGNHHVLWGRSRGSRARQMLVKRAAGCYDYMVSRKIVIRMNRGQSVATMNSGETTYLCNSVKILMNCNGK